MFTKKMPIPATARNAPITSLSVSFSFNIICDGNNIKTGTVAINVDAIPREVNLKATIPNETPKKGPKKDPTTKAFEAVLSFIPVPTIFHLFITVIMIEKPIIPVITRI